MALDPRIILSIPEGIDQNRARNIQQQQADTNRIEASLRAAELQQRMQEMREAAGRKNQPAAYDPQKAKQELEYRLLQGETVAHLLQQAKANPARYGAVRQSIGQLAGPEAMAHLPEEYDDATVTGMIDDGLAHIKQAKDNLQLVTHYDPETQTNVQEFVTPTAGMKLQQAAPKATGEAKPGTLEYYMTSTYGPTPTPEQQRQGRKDFNQSDDRAPRVTVNAGGIGANIPGDFNKTGEDFLAGIPAQWRATVKKIANYDEDPTKVASMRGGLRETLMAWVNQVNPAYDQSQFALRSPTRKAFTTGVQGQQINSINTALGHIDQLSTVAADLENGGFVPGNKAWNAIRTAFGSDKVTNFDTLKDALAGEVDSVLSKSGATVSGIAAAKEKINGANSPTQLAGYAKTIIPVLGSKLSELDYQYHQAMGADDTYSALSPASKSILSKYGFDPKHPEIGSGGASRSSAPAAGRVRVIGPDGQTGTVPAGAALPPGWRTR